MTDYTIRWLDASKTILMCKVSSRWTWPEAFAILDAMNAECDTVAHPVYSIFHFVDQASILPQGPAALSNLKKLMTTEHPNDALVLFIEINPITRRLIDIANRIYGLSALLSRFRFVASLDEGLAEIEKHKQANPVML